MENGKLIVRYMLENYPFKIARKNWYKSGNHSFVGATTNTKNNEIEDINLASESAGFLKSSDLGFLIAVQLDIGKKVWKAWRGPFLIAKSIGIDNFNPFFLSQISSDKLIEILFENKLGCVNLPHKKAAENIISLCKIINTKYEGKPSNVWESSTSFDDLKKAISDLDGFGVGLTNMILRDFVTLGMIPQIKKTAEEMEKLQVKPDVHVKRVFYRSGLAEKENEKAALHAAKQYYKKCPMALDFAAFVIGVDYCGSQDCDNCPIGFRKNGEKLCPRIGL